MKEDVTLAKWLNNELIGKELEAFMAAPEYATYARIKDFSAQLTAPEADMDALYKNIQNNKNKIKQVKVKKLNPWWPRVAAVLIMALGITFYFYATNTTTQQALAGERDTFLLPDYSEVVLNSGSEADYKEFKWSGNRKLELNGEAYFKAAKGKTFDVITPNGTVTVIGTQFNVKARNGRLDVTCFEGKVKVSSGTNTTYLTPGKSVSYENGKEVVLDIERNKPTQPLWLGHEASFNRERLNNIINELELQYKTTIKLNGSPSGKRFTGTLPTNDLNTALDIVQAVYHLKSVKTGNSIILSSE